MSIQVSQVGAPKDVAGLPAVEPRPQVEKPAEPSQARHLHAVEGVIDDTLPTRPPVEVLEEMRAAQARYDELLAQQRELHFKHDDTANRVVVEVRDLEGNVLRTVPPSKALEIIAGGSYE